MDSPFVILNPAARSGRAGNFLEVLQELPGNPVVRFTTRPREAEELAREAVAQGYKKIVAAGGDGLINEVVNGIVSSSPAEPADQPVALGVLPLGTMNVFASELKLPLDSLEAAWEVILENRFRHVDLACATYLSPTFAIRDGDISQYTRPQNDFQNHLCMKHTPRDFKNHFETKSSQNLIHSNSESRAPQQQRFFVQLAGIGLDAEVLEKTSSAFKMAFGPISYFFSFLKVLLKKQPTLLLHCEENGEKKGTSILLGNGKFYGGAFPFFPDATLDDGHLHVLLFKHHHFWELLGNLPALLAGQPRSLQTVQYFKTKELAITPQDPHFQIPFELDGEMVSHLPIKFSIQKQRLQVLV